jgi:hypothetical protein
LSDEYLHIWKDCRGLFEATTQHQHGETEETYGRCWSMYPIIRPRFEPDTPIKILINITDMKTVLGFNDFVRKPILKRSTQIILNPALQ